MKKLDSYWASNKDWYEWTENGERIIKPTAPLEAKKSYKRYLEQMKSKAL